MARVQATNRVKIDDMPYTLHFDGTQRMAITTLGTLGSSLSGAFSFGCWVKTTSMGTSPQYIFGCSNSAGGNYAFLGMTRLSTRIGKLLFNVRDATGRILQLEALNSPVNTGRWTHVVFTKDATNTPAGVKIYMNAVSQALTTVSNGGYADPANFDRPAAIGASLGSGAVSNAWIGSISHPRFFQRELTQQEITDWLNLRTVPANSFAGYANTEGSGTSVADSGGNYNGTLTAAGQWSSTDVPYASRPARTY